MLPQKPYPLKVFISRNKDRNIRYEQANRTKTDVLEPGLAAVRRYESDMGAVGFNWSFAPAETFKFNMEMLKSDMTSSRNYDFDEDKDIWVAFSVESSGITPMVDTITVVNLLEDDSLWVFITSTQTDSFPTIIIDTIGIGETGMYEVNPGLHEIEFNPFYYNSYRTLLDIDDNISCDVLYKIPAAPNDLEQESDLATFRIEYNDGNKIKNETDFNSISMNESVQKLDNSIRNLINTLSYDRSANTKLSMQTTFTNTESVIDTISSQKASMFSNKMGASWAGNSGISTNLNYNFTKISTENDGLKLDSKTNILMHDLLIPLNWNDYQIETKNNITSLSDNFGYKNNQYSTEIINSLEYSYNSILFTPNNITKLSYTKQENPTSSNKEINNKTSLISTIPDIWKLGSLRLLTEYSWKKLIKGASNDIRKKLKIDAGLIRKFNKNYKIGLYSTYERESYGGSVPVAGENPNQKSPAKEPKSSTMYKIDIGATPLTFLQTSFNYSIIKQEGVELNKMNISLIAEIPKINLPIKTSYLSQGRSITGIPKQTENSIECKTSYQFRRISFILTYRFRNENLKSEEYNYHELMGKISRSFNLI